jgi:hypothetical protein
LTVSSDGRGSRRPPICFSVAKHRRDRRFPFLTELAAISVCLTDSLLRWR